VSVIAAYLVMVAEFTQALVFHTQPELRLWSLGLRIVYLILFTGVIWLPPLRLELLHSYFAVQSAIVTTLLLIHPELGAATALFVLLAFQAALVFAGAVRWIWVALFAVCMAGPLIFHFWLLEGLARALMPMAGSFVVSAYIIVNHEIEEARIKSQAMLHDLESLHSQLEKSAAEAEELSVMGERNRLARELHDSVSQILFSITLQTRSTQILLEREPAQVRLQLENLQQLTRNALTAMRGQITQLRPKND
jgi:signal transduction histidine kinase